MSITYRADVDGLRAVAVLAVVIFHMAPSYLPGGFIGVDIFFVISGYLITSILLDQIRANRFSLAEFYRRRIRRIFPALIVVTAATLIGGYALLYREEFRQLGRHVAAAALFVSNLQLWSESGYFDRAAESKPLLHLWSLGIEEQFYIVWPCLIWAISRVRRGLVTILVPLTILSLAVSIYWSMTDTAMAYYLPVSRFWQLATGGLVAHALARRDVLLGARAATVASALGAAMLVAGLVLISGTRPYPGYWALLPTVGTALLIASGPQTLLNRGLSRRPLVWIGLISYPLYLWHWPVLTYLRFVENFTPSPLSRVVAVGASVALAALTYHLVEKPVRLGGRGAWVPALVTASVVLLATGYVAHDGWVRPRNDPPELQELLRAVEDWEYPRGWQDVPGAPDGVRTVGATRPATTLLIGDSHLEQYGPRLLALTESSATSTPLMATSGSCVPIPGTSSDSPKQARCDALMGYALAKSRALGPQDAVVLGACWNCYFGVMPPGVLGWQWERIRYVVADADGRPSMATDAGQQLAFERLTTLMKDLATRTRVFLVLDTPIDLQLDPMSRVAGSRLTGVSVRPPGEIQVSDGQRAMTRRLIAAATAAGAVVLDPATSLFCGGETCPTATPDGRPFYKDTNHLRASYAKTAATFIDPVLASQAVTPR